MAADLYLHSEFDEQNNRWSKQFDKAWRKREELTRGTPEHKASQKEVVDYYNSMFERGYFRDSYGDSNLLWRYGLSWWEDVGKLLNHDRELTPVNAKRLLTLLDRHETELAAQLAKLPPEDAGYFLDKRRDFLAFLRHAIELGEPIDCSL